MSLFKPTGQNKGRPKVHFSQYIKTENRSDEAEANPSGLVNSEQPEAK